MSERVCSTLPALFSSTQLPVVMAQGKVVERYIEMPCSCPAEDACSPTADSKSTPTVSQMQDPFITQRGPYSWVNNPNLVNISWFQPYKPPHKSLCTLGNNITSFLWSGVHSCNLTNSQFKGNLSELIFYASSNNGKYPALPFDITLSHHPAIFRDQYTCSPNSLCYFTHFSIQTIILPSPCPWPPFLHPSN